MKPRDSIYIMKNIQTGMISPVWRSTFRRDKMHLQGWRLYRQTSSDDGTKFLKQTWRVEDFFRQQIEPFSPVDSAFTRNSPRSSLSWEIYSIINHHLSIHKVWGDNLAYLTKQYGFGDGRFGFGKRMVPQAVWWGFMP